jgi:PAS domain S-box-containing protein
MRKKPQKKPDLARSEIEQLRARLEEAEQTLDAIRTGQIDALIVSGPAGERVFTLQGADHRYRRIVESMTEGAAIVSADGILLYANNAFATLVATPLDHVLGSPLRRYAPKESYDAIDSLVRRAQRGTAVADTTLLGKADVPVRVHISAANDGELDQGGVCLIVTDLSTSLRDEETRKKELKEQLAEKTRALSHALDQREKLLWAEKEARALAESASMLKDEFLATLSHELRTPLNAILGWSRMLVAGTVPEEKKAHALATIVRNASSQHQLIEDLLDVSRIVSGKLRLSVEPMDLSAVIDAAIDAVHPAADAKGVKLSSHVDANAGLMRGDSARLQQVVWNLATNAVKFTPRGGSIDLRLESKSSNVRLTVTDTGTGIAAEFLPYVFDRFRQEDGGITRRAGGLGLGLSIAKQIVELHGGTMEVKSDGVGKGSTFIVELPLAPSRKTVAVERRLTPIAKTVAADTAPRELNGLAVLVLDDEEDARDLLRSSFEQHGAVVATAGNVPEALEIIANQSVNVIVSDIGMPEEDGYSFIRKVRALEPEKGGLTPALALTAYARPEDRIRALREGFQTHAAKPVEPQELLAIVANLARHA